MPRFHKQIACPPADTLRAHHAGELPLLAQQVIASHLGRCEFCAAAAQLLARPLPAVTVAPAPPPLPLALRLYAETMLAAAADRAVARRLRAA